MRGAPFRLIRRVLQGFSLPASAYQLYPCHPGLMDEPREEERAERGGKRFVLWRALFSASSCAC